MVPSQKAREKALKRTSQQGISRVYTIIGGGVLVIGIIFALIPVALNISSRTKYGFATDDVITATIILELMGLFLAITGVIFIVVGKYAVKSAEKALSKGEINYPAAESKHTKEQLLQEAATIGQLPNSILTVEVFGDWIDFTAILGSMMLDGDTVFKKLILVQNDYTYRELDYEYGRAIVSDSVGLEEGRTTLGKVQKRKVFYRKNEDGSVTKYTLVTTDITNDIHKWLADRGYSKVGWRKNMVIPESIIPCGIKLIFFDYDDTLFVHYAANRFGDDDKIMRAILSEEAILPGSGYRVYENLGVANPLIKQFVEEDAKNIDKLCITWVADSIMLPPKKQWLDKYYPGLISDVVGTSSPSRKIQTMRLIAESRKLRPSECLIIDDKYDTVAQAIEAGYRGMTTVEVMTRKYYQDIIKSAPKKEKEPLP